MAQIFGFDEDNLPPLALLEQAKSDYLKPDLLQQAQKLYAAGFTPLASVFKAPRLFAWKEPKRDELYRKTIDAINAGRANSLNIRLDGDLAALDLDFRDDRLTRALVAAFKELAGDKTYTTRGAKGCKIFMHLLDKENHLRDRLIGTTVYPPETLFTTPEECKDVSCDLELKTDLAAVFGRHSETVNYSFFPETKAIINATPDDLPKLYFDELEPLFKRAVRAANFVPWGGATVSEKDRQRAFICMALAQVLSEAGAYESAKLAPLLRHILIESGGSLELAAIDSLQDDHDVTQWENVFIGLKENLRHRPSECDILPAFFAAFETDRRKILAKLIELSPTFAAPNTMNYNIFLLQSLLENERARQATQPPGKEQNEAINQNQETA